MGIARLCLVLALGGVVLLTAVACRSTPPAASPPAATPPVSRETPPAAAGKTPPQTTPREPAPEPHVPEPPSQPAPEPPPPVTVTVTPATLRQGDLAVVTVRHAPGTPDGELDARVPLRFFSRGDVHVALVAAAAGGQPGPRRLLVRWPGGEQSATVMVAARAFPEDRLTVDEGMAANTLDNPKAAEEALELARLRRDEGLLTPLWSGAFRLPVPADSPVTTEFGEVRYVNGRWAGQHTGVDFGADTGQPVVAPARGRVLMARELVITGNTILLDHGGQLFTLYGHLDSIAVEAYQTVEPGALLGAVGSTGLSTGPHLHWSAYVGNIPVDPWPLVEGDILAPAAAVTPDR